MERLVDIIAPASRRGYWVKSILLIVTYTSVDIMIRHLVDDQFNLTNFIYHVITLLISAPFAFFVMWIMAKQRALKEELRAMSQTDSLTGLPNRACFLSRSGAHLETRKTAAALMIDLDHFKKINDTYGHYFGDQTLRHVADHLRKSVRDTDIVGRLGGEEFAVFLPETSPQEARKIAERICTPLRITSAQSDGTNPVCADITMSVGGVMTLPDDSLVCLLNHADEAMYQAKTAGRARVVFHDLRICPDVPATG